MDGLSCYHGCTSPVCMSVQEPSSTLWAAPGGKRLVNPVIQPLCSHLAETAALCLSHLEDT